MAWAETAGALYTAGADRQVVRLDPGNGSVVSRFEAGQHPLAALAVTPDGRRAFAASTAVAAWDPAEQRRLFKYTGHPVRTLSAAASHVGDAKALSPAAQGAAVIFGFQPAGGG